MRSSTGHEEKHQKPWWSETDIKSKYGGNVVTLLLTGAAFIITNTSLMGWAHSENQWQANDIKKAHFSFFMLF